MSDQAELSGAPERVVVSHLRPQDFRLDGLRPYAAYRDFDFARATRGAMTAHVLRFVPGYSADVAGKRHVHDVDFQMVYLFKGWISYEFEGVGPIRMAPGDAWTQPPAIRHTVTGYSDDCELMELVMPVEYDTIDVDPAGTTPDETTSIVHLLTRRAAPQRFVVSRAGDPCQTMSGVLRRDFGFAAATGGLADAGEWLLRPGSGNAVKSLTPADSIRLGYVISGSATVTFDAGETVEMRIGSCWLEPPGCNRTLQTLSASCNVLEVTARLPA